MSPSMPTTTGPLCQLQPPMHAAEHAVRIDRPARRREVVAHRGAADRAAEIPALEHILGRQRLLVDGRKRRRWKVGTKDWA